MAPLGEFVAKAVRADDDSRLQTNSSPKLASRGQNHSWHEPAIVTDDGVATDKYLGLKMAALAYHGTRLNHTEGSNARRGGNPRPVRHHRRGVDARSRRGRQQ